jgi:4,5-DOPA dioxygenase extradiol
MILEVFQKSFFEVEYPAPGSPELAQEISKNIVSTSVGLDHDWGLDHGAWIIRHMYPNADIPICK